MNNHELIALQEVIDYLHDDERKHWEEEGEPKKHIYSSIQILVEWLKYN